MKLLKAYFAGMRGRGMSPARPSWNHIMWSFIGGGLVIAIMGWITQVSGHPWLMAPFGASTVLVFGMPDSPLAQPRNIIGGHLVSVVVGLLCLNLLGSHWWSMGMAVALAIAAMQASRTTHAPAGANPLLVMNGVLGWDGVLMPVLSGAILLTACGLLFNNLPADRCYPKYWR